MLNENKSWDWEQDKCLKRSLSAILMRAAVIMCAFVLSLYALKRKHDHQNVWLMSAYGAFQGKLTQSCSLMCFMCCKYAEQKRKQAQMIMAHYSPLSICSLICTCVLVDYWYTTSYGLKEQSKCPKCYVSILKQCSKKWQTLESKIMKSVKGLAVFRQGSKPPIWSSFWRLGPRI